MINKIGKITLYVDNQEKALVFWTEKMGFTKTFDQEIGPGFRWIEVAPKDNEETTLILYSKEVMKQVDSAMLVHPAMLFSTKDIETTFQELKNNDVKVDEMQQMPYGIMFSFYDQDGNTFLIREDK